MRLTQLLCVIRNVDIIVNRQNTNSEKNLN